jgi:hypothetical protein
VPRFVDHVSPFKADLKDLEGAIFYFILFIFIIFILGNEYNIHPLGGTERCCAEQCEVPANRQRWRIDGFSFYVKKLKSRTDAPGLC